jgi:hypothetical protein
MRNFVDCQKKVLVCCCTDYVGRKEEFPRAYGGLSEKKGTAYLDRDNENDDVFREWLRSTELRYLGPTVQLAQEQSPGDRNQTDLRVSLDDLMPPRPMGLLLICLTG